MVEALFHHVWRGGLDAACPERLAVLRAALAPERDPDGPEVKAELRAAGDAALAQGVFGVPTVVLDGRAFWGDDALPMLKAALQGDAWFAGPAWDQAAQPRPRVFRA